jgi:hypothetical protein
MIFSENRFTLFRIMPAFAERTAKPIPSGAESSYGPARS